MKDFGLNKAEELNIESLGNVAGGSVTQEQIMDLLTFADKYNLKARELYESGNEAESYRLFTDFHRLLDSFKEQADSAEGVSGLFSDMIDLESYG